MNKRNVNKQKETPLATQMAGKSFVNPHGSSLAIEREKKYLSFHLSLQSKNGLRCPKHTKNMLRK